MRQSSTIPGVLCLVLLLLCSARSTAQFQRLYGNAQDNQFSKIIPDGLQFYVLGIDAGNATITRISSTGQQLWTRRLGIPSGLTDAVLMPNTGDLMFVGFSLPFNTNNKSLLGVINSQGVVNSIIEYDTPGTEAFSNIVVNPGGNSFSVLGFHSPQGTQEVVFLQVSTNAIITSKRRFSGPDARFATELEVYAPATGGNDFLVAGSWGTAGVIYRMDNTGMLVNGVIESDPYTFKEVTTVTNGDVLATMQSSTGAAPRLVRFDSNLLPLWDVDLNGMDDVYQVIEANFGDFYALGTGVFNGLHRAVILKLHDNGSASPTLIWMKYLDHGETSYSDGIMALLPLGNIAFADGRTGNPTGLGQNDAYFAMTNGNLTSDCTVKDTIILQTHTALWSSPVPLDLLNYDPPVGFDVDDLNAAWQQRAGCSVMNPIVYCGNTRVLVEPEYNGRAVFYQDVTASGDSVGLVCSPASGSFFPVGTTPVTCTATDANGDTASCTFTLTVEKMPFDSLEPPADYSPEGLFDRARDRFGNPYRLADLQIPEALGGSLLCVISGYFNLYFEPGCGMDGNSAVEVDRRNVLCQLYKDLSQFIARPAGATAKVNIWVRNLSNMQGASSNTLGIASSFYTVPNSISNGPFTGGLVDGEVWKTINSGMDSYTGVVSPLTVITGGNGLGFYHGFVAFNFSNPNIQWHTDLSIPTSFNLVDLYTVALHEATHSLGFASLLTPGGGSVLSFILGGGSAPFPYFFSRYDDFLWTNPSLPGYPNKKLLTNTGPCKMYNYQFNPAVNPNVLQPYFAGAGPCLSDYTSCTYALEFVSPTVSQPVYTPNCWEGGSSLSHLEDACRIPIPQPNNLYYVMSNAGDRGPAYMKRSLRPEERQVLCELGYQTGTAYGNAAQLTNANYPGGICPGIGVAGVNDGILPNGSFTYVLGINSLISGIDIMVNDVAAGFECLEVIYGGGTASPASGNSFNTISYNSPANPGIKLLRYIPVSSSGKKGNITYVFIRVNAAGCPAGVCNKVVDAGFENAINCGLINAAFPGPYIGGMPCWDKLSGTPDLISRNCIYSPYAINFSTNPDTWNGSPNNHYIGLWATTNPPTPPTAEDFESVQTTLGTPITQGIPYTISFRARIRYPGAGNTKILIAGSVAKLAPVGWAFTPLLSNPNVKTLVSAMTVLDNGTWNYVTATFTYTSSTPLNNLIVANYPGTASFPGNKYVFIDDIQISPQAATPTFTPPTPLCTNAPIVLLNPTVSIPGGVFTGTGVSNSGSNYYFSPSSGVGNHVITYTVTDLNGCPATATATIVVAIAPVVSYVQPVNPYCLNDPAFNLSSLVTPGGGTFSGQGVTGTTFIPANAGLGTHPITYFYSGGACPTSITFNIQVKVCGDTCEISNRCLDFDGADDYVDVTNPLNTPGLQNNFTVACWFRDDLPVLPIDGWFHHLFGFSWSGPVFEVGETDGHLTFNGGTLLQSNTVLIRDGKWHHLAAVKNGNLATIFLDGVPVIGMINLNVGTYTGAAQNFHIGDWTSGGLFPRFWKGQIDEFKVWGAALGTLQVQEEMFCSLDPKNVNLLVHFPFDQYTAWGNNLGQTLAQNVVLSGPNGTLKNFALLGNTSNWVGRGRDRLPNCNVDHFAWYEGNNRGNYAGRSKVYDGDIFTAGQEIVDPILTPLDEGHPTFTRRRPDGSVAWRVLFNIQGVLNDFIRTDEGCYLLVGHTPKYLLNNRCFIARVSPTGALQWMHEFDFANDRESLNRIIRSDNPSAGLYPYIISGIMRNPMPGVAGSTYDDVLLLAVDNQGSIGWMRKLGDNAGSFTDDEFHADLINFNGGYALTGLYRNTIIAYPVIFQTDYAGVQRSISTQYQSGDYFSDIEPISNGSALIIAGQLSNGNALLAKVDASGNQIWSKAFPLLGAFRKLVIQPNGDIYAVGQRKLPLGRYHNVIVKVHDSGTTMSVIWQKSAEQAVLGEFEWKPADLAWYSGKMFFFTDTRYILRPGWYNGNIGAAMYALDQTPDICPFIKEALPVPVDYPLLRSQMAPLTGNPFTPPAPIIGIPAAALVLPRDSLCPDYGCDCSFIQLVFSKNWPIPVWSKSVADCGLAPVALPGCPSQYNPIKFSGKLQCKGGCAFNGITWTITDPNNIVTTGASASAFFNIPLPLSLLQIPAPGVYTIVLTGKCGTKTCTCTVKFTVPACPPPCDCTEPKFTNDVNAGFNWIQLPNCQFKFTAKSLTPCDVVAWKVAASGTNLFTTIAVGSGNQTINYQFPVTGQYVVCMTVKRTPAGGGLPCTKSRCWTLDVDCSLLADFANLQDNCSGSVVENSGFTLGAEAGGLLEDGAAAHWNASGGNPGVLLEPGKLDPNFVRLRGSGLAADLLYQDSLPLNDWDSVRFTMGIRPLTDLILPGTELVVRLSAERQDSLLCQDSSCLEMMRLPLADLDSSIWLTAGTSLIIKNSAFRFLTVQVENPFFEDDLSAKSVVDIDNICLSKYELVATKQPEQLQHFRIFPNPNPGTFTVQLPQAAGTGMIFRIVGLTGQALLENPSQPGMERQTVNATILPPGLYFLEVVAEGRVLAIEKFVKQ